MIGKHFQPWIAEEKVARILDLCCGGACIAIACAQAFPNAQVDAVDISPDVLDVAAINVKRYQLQDRVHLIKSDLFTALDQQYDIIITNPPYVDAEDMADLPEEYQWEPELALAAGEDGLDVADKILAQAKSFLSSDGILIMEVGNSAGALEAKHPELPCVWLEFEQGGDGVVLLEAKDLSIV